MSRNNTGNPIGSKAFPDFEDNVKSLDQAVNAEQDTFQDRLGKSRLTWSGMENQFAAAQSQREAAFDAGQSSREAVFSDFLQVSGYQDLGEYAPGIEITAHNQYVTFGGQPYLLKPSIPVPYTTSGEWTGDDFKLIGDDSLRQDLANPEKGAAMVGYIPEGDGASPTSVQKKLREFVNVADYKKPEDGDDWYPAFRRAIVLRKQIRVDELPDGEWYGVSQAIVTPSDTWVDLLGIGKPRIRLTSPPAVAGGSTLNTMIRPSQDSVHFSVVNFSLRGNYDGTGTVYDTGVGVWLRQMENCVPWVDNVDADYFTAYGHYYYVYRAAAGRIFGSFCRFQGVAVTNVRDGLDIAHVEGEGNEGAALDIEYSASRPVGLNNIRVGRVVSRNNERNVIITSGSATNEILAGHGLTSEDFNVVIGDIHSEGGYLDGVLIDIPYCKIGSIRSKGDVTISTPSTNAGVIVRGALPLRRGAIEIGTIMTDKSTNGFLGTCDIGFPYQSVKIGALETLNSTRQGVLAYPTGWAKSFVVEAITDTTVSELSIPSTVDPGALVLRGSLFRQSYRDMIRRTKRVVIPANLSESLLIRLAPESYLERVVVSVQTPSAVNSRARIRVGGSTKADIRLGVAGPRILGIRANDLLGTDTDTAPIGSDLSGDVRLEPIDTPWGGDVVAFVYLEYNSLN